MITQVRGLVDEINKGQGTLGKLAGRGSLQ
jgi:hypothetical protein